MPRPRFFKVRLTLAQGPPQEVRVRRHRDRPVMGLPRRGLQETLGDGQMTSGRLLVHLVVVAACFRARLSAYTAERRFCPTGGSRTCALEAYLLAWSAGRRARMYPTRTRPSWWSMTTTGAKVGR